MKISKIFIKNIRCFDELKITFDNKNNSILIAGDNGDGKSTLLRCIAMGLCDEDSAAALLRELDGDFVRHKSDGIGIIEIYLNNKAKRYKIVTKITSLKAFEKLEQNIFENKKATWVPMLHDSFPWEDIFVCGYGAGVRVLGTGDYKDYVSVDAVYPLFKYDWPLQNPELTIRRMIDKARRMGGSYSKRGQKYADNMREYILNLLKKILNLNINDNVILGDFGIEIKSYWGINELGALGDGYRATTNWIMDLFSWWMLYLDLLPNRKNIYSKKEIIGIVILDEIEQHLHPRWQLKMLGLLKETFTNIQFIVTTHSPLILSGSGSIPIHSIEHGEHKIINASGWLAEDIYRDIMGLTTTRSSEVKAEIDEYKYLYLKKLSGKVSSKELLKMRLLKTDLINKLPNTDPIVEVNELKNITKFLEKTNAKRKETSKTKFIKNKLGKMEKRIVK